MSRAEFTCRVVPQYLPDESSPDQGQYAFAYTVSIENSGDITGQLIGRHWLITDALGVTQEVRGLAVVGHQPVLRPGERFEYSSWTRIGTPTGVMRGSFLCVTEQLETFQAEVPPFDLVVDEAAGTAEAPRVLH